MIHTSFEFKLPAQDVHEQLHHRIHRCQRLGEQKEPNHDGLLPHEAKGLVQGAVVDKCGEQREDVEQVRLSN